MPRTDDVRWLDAAARLSARARPLSRPNPGVAAIIVREGKVVGRGWTQAGGRPHAEAVALAEASSAAQGATLYVTLEPCAHPSARGPACADMIARSGLTRVVIGCSDPDPRTAGQGIARINAADIAAELLPSPACQASLAGYLKRHTASRPHVTLKLAMSLDGGIALANGTSQWITGEPARAHGHALRASSDAILVGGGTLRADSPGLDVRLPGLEQRSPDRWVLTRGPAPAGWPESQGWNVLHSPHEITGAMPDVQYLLVEGGAGAAAAFLGADLVDRLVLYRAPILIGGGKAALVDIGLTDLSAAHGRWQITDRRQLGNDTMEVYERSLCSPE